MNRNLLRQAQELQARLAKAQEELAAMTVEASAGGGAVKIVMTGQQKLQSVAIDQAVIASADKGMLEDLMLAVFNDALEKSHKLASDHMSKLTGGLKIPGLG